MITRLISKYLKRFKMKKQLDKLKEFHQTFDHPVEEKPTIPDEKVKRLREKLIQEELEELQEAADNDDLVEVADALADLLYVVYGAAHCYGLADALEECFDEVHRSNMSKTDKNGNPIFREDGKILKGGNYTRPNLETIVAEYISE